MVPLLLSEQLGVEKIGSSYGLVRFFQAGANFFGPILAGMLWEKTGRLEFTFFYMGSVMCLGSVFALFQPLAVKREEKKEQRNKEIKDLVEFVDNKA